MDSVVAKLKKHVDNITKILSCLGENGRISSISPSQRQFILFTLIREFTMCASPINKYIIKRIITEMEIEPSEEQVDALRSIIGGNNTFVTGGAGVGKSFLIDMIRLFFLPEAMCVTSTTGVSALNIGGVTINYFSGIGLCEEPADVLINKVIKSRRDAVDRISRTRTLIIDEISMMSHATFTKLDALFRAVRKNVDCPFGGMQIIAIGDFLQLPPVIRGDLKPAKVFAFESDIWKTMFPPPAIAMLKKVFRQDDPEFYGLLNKIRTRTHRYKDIQLLENVKNKETEEGGVILFPKVAGAATQNKKELDALKTVERKFEAKFTGNDKKLLSELHQQFDRGGCSEITLKKGARVMLTYNVDLQRGLANGSLGTVVDFSPQSDRPIVRFDIGGMCIEIEERVWERKSYKRFKNGRLDVKFASASQIPLILAWALTIHRVQGLSLSKATMHLASCFENHQVYVALSRVRTIGGMGIETFEPSKIKVDHRVIKYYDSIANGA